MFPSPKMGPPEPEPEMPGKKPLDDADAIEVVRREDWGAVGPLAKEPNVMPVQEVYFTETDTNSCTSRESCTEIVQAIQKFHMTYGGLTDIHYHFLIGGDGRVYEGRGWFTKGPKISPKRSKIPPEMEGKHIEIAFIGKYDENEPTQEMQDAVNSLIAHGMENDFLEKEEVEEEKGAGESDKGLLEKIEQKNDDSK